MFKQEITSNMVKYKTILIIGMLIVAKFDIGKSPNIFAKTLTISNNGFITTSKCVINGIINDSIPKTNAIVKPIVKIGIKIMLAKIEIMFRLLKK